MDAFFMYMIACAMYDSSPIFQSRALFNWGMEHYKRIGNTVKIKIETLPSRDNPGNTKDRHCTMALEML